MPDQPGVIRFTIEERILLHLLEYTTHRQKIEVPPSITQEGISTTIRIHRKHLPRSLKSMLEKNLITENTAHVQGQPQRMKTYHLTLNGEAKAQELKDSITNLTIHLRDTQGNLKETTIKDIQTIVKGLHSLAELLSCITEEGIIDLTQTTQPPQKEQQKDDRITIYQKALEQAWKDGKMTRSERDLLLNLRKSLNITEKQHLQYEEEILKDIKATVSSEVMEVYKIALKQALEDNRISPDERAILEKIRKHFNIKNS